MWNWLRDWARALKRMALALWIATRDARTPLLAKFVALATSAYAFSPIDLIPDFVPVLGLLDDLLLVPAGLWLAMRSIPPALMDEFRRAAAAADRPVSRLAAAVILAVWVICTIFLFTRVF
jgi:uncharacterized membrane protein YkvA (DUF1232 family)